MEHSFSSKVNKLQALKRCQWILRSCTVKEVIMLGTGGLNPIENMALRNGDAEAHLAGGGGHFSYLGGASPLPGRKNLRFCY